MKSSWIYITILILLIGLAAYLYVRDESSTLNPRLSDFSLDEKELQEVDSVLLTRHKETLQLHRRQDQWYLNRHFHARNQKVRHLFNVFRELQVEAPVRKSNRQKIVEMIRMNSIHVRIYRNNKLIKNYLLDDSKKKPGISYMMMAGSKKPFIMSLPGYEGDIAGLFRFDPAYWRDKTLFDFSGTDIQRIKVLYASALKQSFVLSYQNEAFQLRSPDNNQYFEHFSSTRPARYFSYFGNVRFHSVIQNDERLADSLGAAEPYCFFEITDQRNNATRFYIYRKGSAAHQDPFGQKSRFDLNYLYGRFGDRKEILLIKYTEFDPLLKEIHYFREGS
jgi:hypothetical protein